VRLLAYLLGIIFALKFKKFIHLIKNNFTQIPKAVFSFQFFDILNNPTKKTLTLSYRLGVYDSSVRFP